jgi:two-component system, OmpR family, sensor histidine kinase KdpD
MDGAKKSERSGPVIVALGPGAYGEILVARAKSIAEEARRELTCLTVDDGGLLSGEARDRLTAYHDLARSKGAMVMRIPGIDVAGAVADYAEAQDSPTVVVGGGASISSRKSVAARLAKARRGFAVVAVCPPERGSPRDKAERHFPASGSLAHYLAAMLMVGCVTAANLFLASYAGYWAAAILYLAAISLGALWLESGPILLAAIASALAWDFLFIPPRFTLTIDRPEDDLMLALYVVVSLSSGLMTARLRSSERLLREREGELSRINALALSLAGAMSEKSIIARGIASLKGAIDCEAIAILSGGDGRLKSQPEDGWTALDAAARSAAKQCFEEGEVTGRYTRAFPDSEWHFAVIDSPQRRLGVIGLRRPHDADWDEFLETYLRTIVSTMAMALARAVKMED